MDTNIIKCDECGALNNRHNIKCSKLTIEDKAKLCDDYYLEWHRYREWSHKRIVYLQQQVTLWQGKFNIVKHENNQLRRKRLPK